MAPWSGDPLRDKRDSFGVCATEYQDLKLADADRLNRYIEYRKENEAAREVDMVRTSGTDYGLKSGKDGDLHRHNIQLPFGVALTVKHTYRVAGRLPDAIVDRREETPQERYRSDTMEKIWWSTLRESGEDTLIAEGAWDGSSLGATVFDLYFEPVKQRPLIRACDPAGTVVVRGVDDVHDFQRVYRAWDAPLASVRAEYEGLDLDGTGAFASPVSELQSTHKVGMIPMVTIVQMTDREKTVRFALGGEMGCVPLYERYHGLGFVPYVVIPNIGPYRDVWGWADYEFVRALVAYMPQLMSREADILRMVANGGYIEKGTGQQPEQVDKVLKYGGTLPSKRDGDVTPIEPPQVPAFAVDHAERVMDAFKKLGFAPDASWGSSDTRSGPDRALQLQPLIELTAMKQTNWSAGLSRLAMMVYRMMETKQVNPTVFRGARPGLTPGQSKPFKPFTIGPDVEPEIQAGEFEGEEIILPRSPKELFQKDYSIRFVWQNRIDPDDPAYVLSELNKFAQGVQSLRTTLERLGFQAPEDEIKLIEEEAGKHPWLRQGMIALLKMQMDASQQGEGGGAPTDPLGGLMGGLGQLIGGQPSGNDAANAGAAALPGGLGKPYGA